METKMIKIPFEVELAKKISNGEVEGRIVTRDGRSARVICWDKKNSFSPIIALIDNDINEEIYASCKEDGSWYCQGYENLELMLEVPESIMFKDGDIVSLRNGDIAIIKGEPFKNVSGNLTLSKTYIRLSGNTLGSLLPIILNDAKKAAEDEINMLKEKMQDYNDPYVKSLCKRFFGIEEKPKCKFKPFDRVLVKDVNCDIWHADIFSHVDMFGRYICVGRSWLQCIPYNEQTAHLLGTTENYE